MPEDRPGHIDVPTTSFNGEVVRNLGPEISLTKSKDGKLWVAKDIQLTEGNKAKVESNLKKWEALRSFGYNIPDFSVVTSNLDGNNRLYLLSEYVDGVPLSKAPQEVGEEVRKTNEAYYVNAFNTGTDSLAGLVVTPYYVYGSIDGKEIKPYFVHPENLYASDENNETSAQDNKLKALGWIELINLDLYYELSRKLY